jgi:Flp pilus assembly protein TadB
MGNNQQTGFHPFKRLDVQVREVLQQMEARAETLEKDMRKNELYRKAKRWQKDLEKRAKSAQKDLDKRVKTVQRGIHKRRDDAYHLAGLATKAEVDSLNRRLRELNRIV